MLEIHFSGVVTYASLRNADLFSKNETELNLVLCWKEVNRKIYVDLKDSALPSFDTLCLSATAKLETYRNNA